MQGAAGIAGWLSRLHALRARSGSAVDRPRLPAGQARPLMAVTLKATRAQRRRFVMAREGLRWPGGGGPEIIVSAHRLCG